jgi:endoglucanase
MGQHHGVQGTRLLLCLVLGAILPAHGQEEPSAWIRVNQLGYLPNGPKAAVCVAVANEPPAPEFSLVDVPTGMTVWSSPVLVAYGSYGPFQGTWRLDFSAYARPGRYLVRCGTVSSPPFQISPRAYEGIADTLLCYMRQQRCGDNPFLDDSCHTRDGYIIYHDSLQNTFVDVRGGWHDASDYLQYVTTSATATFQMLDAYRRSPGVFGDQVDASGRAPSNARADILDEGLWGLRWLTKMDPDGPLMFNQIADDRDHRGFRLPTEDTVDYGRGRERPVYVCTGLPQGLFAYQNRSTGQASTAGKFASAFAMGALVLRSVDPALADTLRRKAEAAYRVGIEHPGVCQTAPCNAPYFYEEENWVDDMELAAATLAALTGRKEYREEAIAFGAREPVTPWMETNAARHYQWYPFLNLGHVLLAEDGSEETRSVFGGSLRSGLEMIWKRASANAFHYGIPFLWCSNNLTSAALAQSRLYRELTKDSTFLPMEGALRDWLFGCNPWGTSMVVGLPSDGDFPEDPHSAFSHVYGYPITGGLVDGPVAGSVFSSLRGVHLSREDPYGRFQSALAVYHDDWADYSTNEPTMDGTAGLIAPLASLAAEGSAMDPYRGAQRSHGGIIRMDTSARVVYICFTGHEFAEGGEQIAATLRRQHVPASFFFTGDFYRRPDFQPLLLRLRAEGHYLGAHSDRHLLYAPWDQRDSLLVSRAEFQSDLIENLRAMARLGIPPDEARCFMPPYEWYNRTIAEWTGQMGLTLVNFTPGTGTNADYTTPDMGQGYRSSQEIVKALLEADEHGPSGLNGCILLMHVGTDPARADKLYGRLDELLVELRARGYHFGRFY